MLKGEDAEGGGGVESMHDALLTAAGRPGMERPGKDTPHRRCAPAQTRYGADAVLGGAALCQPVGPWGGYRHCAEAYPGQDGPGVRVN